MAKKKENVVFLQHRKLLGYVKKNTDLNRYKDDIITEFYNSGILKEKISGMMYRNKIKLTTQLLDDFENEVWYWLCRKPAEYIIEIYERNPNKLIGLAVTIAKFKCFTKSSREPEYPKHSLMMNLLYASNLRSYNSLSVEWSGYDDYELVNGDDEFLMGIWNVVAVSLADDELNFIETLYKLKKRKLSKVNQSKYDNLLTIIKQILIEEEFLKNDLKNNVG